MFAKSYVIPLPSAFVRIKKRRKKTRKTYELIEGNYFFLNFLPTRLCLVLMEKVLHICRGYMHSLTTAVTAFSAALGGLACGFMIVLFVDELNFFLQVKLIFSKIKSDEYIMMCLLCY